MRNHSLAFPVVALLLACACARIVAQVKACSPEQAQAADQLIDSLDSWSAVNTFFAKYKQCDDGSIAEGSSEAIARLLADRWTTLPELIKLTAQNPPFRTFVLRHINSTLDTDDLDRIAKLAASSCPKESTALCKNIREAVARAMK